MNQKALWDLLKETFKSWDEDRAPRMAAAYDSRLHCWHGTRLTRQPNARSRQESLRTIPLNT